MTRRSASNVALFSRTSLLALAAFGASYVYAGEKDPSENLDARVKEIFDFNRNGVVKIQASDPHGGMEGTGFYADSTGTIYTGLDVIGDGKNITVIQGERKFPAKLEVADPRTGIAIIKVDTTTPFLSIGDSSKVEVYTPLVAIGYPFDKPAIFSAGLVAGLDKQFLNRYFHTTHIRANLPVQPGFGGAPVLNIKGEVVGIIVSGIEGNQGCYILPINAAEKTRTDFSRFHELKPGWVGISVEPVEPATGTSLPSTARVSALQTSAPASRAGIRQGDILLSVGDVAIHAPDDIFDASFFLTAGDETNVTVLRGGKEQKFTIRAADIPSTDDVAQSLTLPDTSILSLGNPPSPKPSP